MPTPDASQFTQLKKYNAVQARMAEGQPQSRTLTHLHQPIPSVTHPLNFLASFTNKYISTPVFVPINRVTGVEYKPKVPGGNVFGVRSSTGATGSTGGVGSLPNTIIVRDSSFTNDEVTFARTIDSSSPYFNRNAYYFYLTGLSRGYLYTFEITAASLALPGYPGNAQSLILLHSSQTLPLTYANTVVYNGGEGTSLLSNISGRDIQGDWSLVVTSLIDGVVGTFTLKITRLQLTILEYNSDYGDSVVWGATTFTKQTGFSYSATITSIPSGAVPNASSLTSVTIPSSVTTIGIGAFEGASTLTSITIPSSVTTIGIGAFENSGLTSVTLPTNLTSISDYMFASCAQLTSIIIPSSVTTIGQGAFSDSGLTSVTIPNSVTSIGESAFSNCAQLTSVTLSANLTSIRESVFSNTGLTSVTIPNSVTSIDDSAFYNCSGLTSITIPNSVTSIGLSAFQNAGLTSITIPTSVTSIGESVFSNCIQLTSVTLPNNLTSIGSFLFAQCYSLISITIPSSVTSIDSYAFSQCTGLTSITIPDSVTTIGSAAFQGCSALTTVYISSETASSLGRASPNPSVSFFGKTVATVLP